MTRALFIHSTGTGPFMWDSVPDEVVPEALRVMPSNLGYPPFAPVPRGQRSSLADDTAHVLRQLPADGDFDLIAHSYGGLLAMDVASKLGARVRSMFLVEPVLFGALLSDETADPAVVQSARAFAAHPWFLNDVERGGTEPWLEVFIDYWNRPGTWARLPELMRGHSLDVGWKMFQEVRSVFFDAGTFDERVLPPVPVTLVMTERSPAEAHEMVRGLARRAPHAKVVQLAGTGHMAPLTHGPKVHAALAEHLASRG